jgi:hypothetical protein
MSLFVSSKTFPAADDFAAARIAVFAALRPVGRYRNGAAVIPVDVKARAEWIEDTIHATAEDTTEEIREMQDDEAMTLRSQGCLRGVAGGVARGYTGVVG